MVPDISEFASDSATTEYLKSARLNVASVLNLHHGAWVVEMAKHNGFSMLHIKNETMIRELFWQGLMEF